MKNIRLFIVSLALINICNQSHSMCFFGSRDDARKAYNAAEIEKFKTQLTAQPMAQVAIVSDLHDVVFDRLPGDIARARQLSWAQWGTMLWNLPLFAAQYGLYKMHLAKHPSIEQRIAHALIGPGSDTLMHLISPFKLNEQMYKLYKTAQHPVFACSNCGEQSHQFLTQAFDKPLFKGIQIATAANGYMQKDQPETYHALYTTMTQVMGQGPDIVIMIDDKPENIERCKKALGTQCTVYGFVFKNVEDLQQTLQVHNITL